MYKKPKIINVSQKRDIFLCDGELRRNDFQRKIERDFLKWKAQQEQQQLRFSRMDFFWYLIEKFGKHSSIHGVDRLVSRTTGKTERILWSIAFVAALILLINVSLIVADRYSRKHFQTIVDTTKYPVYKIPFPEITICNRNRLNWGRLDEAKDQFLLAAHRTKEYEGLFTDVVARFDTLIFGEFNKFANIPKSAVKHLNYVNFSSVVDLMSWRCNEMLENCFWNRQAYNCCEIFFQRKSQLGNCLAFNTIESQEGRRKQLLDPMWPWRNAQSGAGSGLKLKVLLKKQLNSPFTNIENGVTCMVTEPHVYSNLPFNIYENTHTVVAIDAILHFFDEQTRGMAPDERECIFEDENYGSEYKTLQGHRYMFENCQAECQQRYLMDLCNCTTDLFFPIGTYPICELKDYPCLAKHNERILFFEQQGEKDYVKSTIRGMECNCLLNCNSLTYKVNTRSLVLKPEERVENSSFIEVDMFFAEEYIEVLRTRLIYTWVDLLVSFGGIAGLFLGASLMSIVELAYFLLVDIPRSLWLERKNSRKILEENNKHKNSITKLLFEPDRKQYW